MNGDRLGRVVQPGSQLVQFVIERFHPKQPNPQFEWALPLIIWVYPYPGPEKIPNAECGCRLYSVDEASVRILERLLRTRISRSTTGMCACMGRVIE